MMKKICVIGSSNVDLIMQMERLPGVGETVTDASFLQTFGGKGSNSAVAAARAGGGIQFVNCVGDDPYAPAMLDRFEAEGMDISLISRETGISSGTALVMIGGQGTNYLSVSPGANYRLTPERINTMAEELKSARRIMLQCEIPLETNLRVIELADAFGVPVMLNLAPARTMPWEVLRKVETLIVNENEARFLAAEAGVGVADDRDLAGALLVFGTRSVIVTLGPGGSVLADSEGIAAFPAFPIEVVDTTAAGDTYCGALAVALVEGRSHRDAIPFATAASTLCVSRLGAFPSIPKRSEIDAFLFKAKP